MGNEFVKVYSAESKLTAEMLLGALTAEKIPAFRQGKGGGGYMDIYAGDSVFGEDIFVPVQNEAQARSIIEGIMTKVTEEEPEETYEAYGAGFWQSSKARRWTARIIIAVFIIGLLVSYILKG